QHPPGGREAAASSRRRHGRDDRAGQRHPHAGPRPVSAATTYPVINPATEEIVGEVPDQTVADALDAAAAAREAFPAWSRTTPEHRANLLQAVADELRK